MTDDDFVEIRAAVWRAAQELTARDVFGVFPSDGGMYVMLTHAAAERIIEMIDGAGSVTERRNDLQLRCIRELNILVEKLTAERDEARAYAAGMSGSIAEHGVG